MKTSKIFIALVAILSLVNNSSQAQETIITAPGEYVVPYDGNFPRQSVTKIVVEKVAPSQVKIGFGWTTNFWSTPVGHPEDNSYANFVSASLPGPYDNTGIGGVQGTKVSYISDPWVKVDGAVVPEKEHLRDFYDTLQDLPVINAESLVELELSSVFANSSYSKGVYKDVTDVSYEEVNLVGLKAQITQSGRYLLLTASGASSPSEMVYFDVVIGSSGSGMVEAEKEKLFIYPSFVQSMVFLQSESPIKQVAIHAVSGNKVIEREGDIREIEVSSLHSGMYIVRVIFENGKTLSQKIVKY